MKVYIIWTIEELVPVIRNIHLDKAKAEIEVKQCEMYDLEEFEVIE